MPPLVARAIALLGLASALTGCSSFSMDQANAGAAPDTGFMVKTVQVDGELRKFGLFVPHDYKPTARAPVIVFLHGVLQAGSNGTNCIEVGIGPSVAKRAKTFPFIVVFPQSPGDWVGEPRERIALACLDQVQRQYSTDPDRVIVTGLSNGGYGAWAMAAHHPERFSAAVPMAGYAAYPEVPKLTHIPIWCFHNSGDFLVMSGGSEEMCRQIKTAGGNVRLTMYSAIGHDCWGQAYDSDELYQWMLKQRRGASDVASR